MSEKSDPKMEKFQSRQGLFTVPGKVTWFPFPKIIASFLQRLPFFFLSLFFFPSLNPFNNSPLSPSSSLISLSSSSPLLQCLFTDPVFHLYLALAVQVQSHHLPVTFDLLNPNPKHLVSMSYGGGYGGGRDGGYSNG